MLMELVSKVFERLAASLLGEKWNTTMADSKQQCEGLFKSAKHDIRVVTGDLHHQLFEDEKILTTLKDLSTREEYPVTIEIIHGPNPDPKSKSIFKLQKQAKGRVHIMTTPKRPGAHFVLVDGLRYRVEKYHEANQPERMAFMQTKKPIFLNRVLAEKFDDLKLKSHKSGK